MYAFDYVRADSLDKAVALLAEDDEAKVIAGGQTIIPTMKARLAAPTKMIDISKLAELQGISVDGSTVTIGAGTKHYLVENSAEVAKAIPALAHMAHVIGDPAVRHKGTLGGSIANNDPAADYPAACLGLGATIHTNKRQVAAKDFFTGLFDTALEDGEIVVKVSFPIPEKAGYEKFRHPASRFAMCGVFVAKTAEGVVVAVTGCGANGVFRANQLEQALASSFTPDAIGSAKVDPSTLNEDMHGDREYRAALISVVAKRAVAAAK